MEEFCVSNGNGSQPGQEITNTIKPRPPGGRHKTTSVTVWPDTSLQARPPDALEIPGGMHAHLASNPPPHHTFLHAVNTEPPPMM